MMTHDMLVTVGLGSSTVINTEQIADDVITDVITDDSSVISFL
jgi:hypothetical protein